MAEVAGKPEPVPEWEAIADKAHAVIREQAGDPEPDAVLAMLRCWKAPAEPANALGQITFSRALLDSATDALEFLIARSRAALDLLDSYGPDDEQDDDEFVRVRAELRQALEPSDG